MSKRREPFPTGFQAVLLYVALILSEALVGSALRDARGALGLTRGQSDALALLLGNGLVFAVVMHFRKLTYRELFHDSSSSSVRATLALVVPPVLLLVPALLLLIGALDDFLVRLVPLSAWEEQFFARVTSEDFASVIVVCLLGPVFEEMLFRGIVLRGLLERFSRPQAIFGSAVLFGAVHMNIYQFIGGVAIGVLLGWLYERTRSLVPCIALHISYNSGTVLLAAAAQGTNADQLGESSVLIWAMAVAAALLGAIALRRMLSARPVLQLAEPRGTSNE
jgi:membrane protease YdiL (CAAX protease family)